jgi:hypothetical protein
MEEDIEMGEDNIGRSSNIQKKTISLYKKTRNNRYKKQQ